MELFILVKIGIILIGKGGFIMNQKNWDLELSHYIKAGEPNEAFKAKTCETAIGLQDVDAWKLLNIWLILQKNISREILI